MTATQWLHFWMISLAASFSPGPAIVLTLSTAASAGKRGAIVSCVGNAVGILLMATISFFGIERLLNSFPNGLTLLKLIGSFYLIYLGVKLWRVAYVARRESKALGETNSATGRGIQIDASFRTLFSQGLFVAVTNPKSLAFFIAVFSQFLPQSIERHTVFFELTAVFVSCAVAAHLSYIAIASFIQKKMRQSDAWAWRALPYGGASVLLVMGLIFMLDTMR